MGTVQALRRLCLVAALVFCNATAIHAQFDASESGEDDSGELEEALDRELTRLERIQALFKKPLSNKPTPNKLLLDVPLFSDESFDALRNATAERAAFFGGMDVSRGSLSAYGGLLWSPGGFRSDGFIFKALAAEGAYVYLSGHRRILGVYGLASAMPGWRFSSGSFDIKTFAGIDLQYHSLYPDDRGNRLRGGRVGVRGAVETWWEPAPWLMTAASASGSTIGDGYSARLASGLRIANWFWAGPEVEVAGDDVYRQYRIGAHLTAFRFGTLEWSVGAGYLNDSERRSGPYARFSLLARRSLAERFKPF